MSDPVPHDRPKDEPRRTGGFTYAPGSEPLSGYTIKRGLGEGGFGEVYYAVSTAGKEVALKLIRRHLDVELRGVSQCLNLKHPNLVAIYDVRTDEAGNHWIVMEYVAGEKLSDLLDRNPQGIGAEAALAWLRGIAAGTQYLHQSGIVHRDLKPANLFMEQGLVKIGDYGLSKFISVSRRSGHTESVGTVHYMAPEISGGRYGKEIDVYSLGVMLYEMLTGRVPFEGESVGEILMKHLTAEPDLSGVAEPFRSAIAAALQKDPARRTASVAEFLQSVDGIPPQGLPESNEVSPPKIIVKTNLGARYVRPQPPCRDDHPRSGGLAARSIRTSQLRIIAAGGAIAVPFILLGVRSIVSDRDGNQVAHVMVPRGGYVEMVDGEVVRSQPSKPVPPTINIPKPVATAPQDEMHILWGGVMLLAILSSGVVAAGVWLMRRTITASNTPPPPSSVEIFSAPPPFHWRRYVIDVTGAWLLLFAASIVVCRLLMLVRNNDLTLERFVWTTASSFAAAALLAAVGKLPLGARQSSFTNRLSFGGVGAATGAAAWMLADYLHLLLPIETSFQFVSPNRWPECYLDGKPTWLAFVGYFALTFFLVDWRGMMNPLRSRPWRFGSTAVAVFWAFFVNAFFPFPQWWGCLVVAACSLTLPLAFPVRTTAKRRARHYDD